MGRCSYFRNGVTECSLQFLFKLLQQSYALEQVSDLTSEGSLMKIPHYLLKICTTKRVIVIGIAPAIPIKHYKPKIPLWPCVTLSRERMYVFILRGGCCENHRAYVMSAPCVLPIIIY